MELQIVECEVCGFSDFGQAGCCPDCGGALNVGALSRVDEVEPLVHLNLLESGSVSFQPHLLQSVAYRQLREICQAASAQELACEDLEYLLAELEVYLQREILGFELLPEMLDDLYRRGRASILDGLRGLQEACSVAASSREQGPTALVVAERIASEADIRVGQGRQLLDRLAA